MRRTRRASPWGGEFGPVPGPHFHVSLAPALVAAPAVRDANDRSGSGRTLDQVDAGCDDRPLHGGIVRRAAGIAEREVREQESGRPAALDDIDGGTQDHGRNAGGFEMAGRPDTRSDDRRGQRGTRRTASAPSSRHRESYLRCIYLVRAALAVLRRHAVEARCEFADSAGCHQLRQAVDGKVGIEILEMGGVTVPGQIIGEQARWREDRGTPTSRFAVRFFHARGGWPW